MNEKLLVYITATETNELFVFEQDSATGALTLLQTHMLTALTGQAPPARTPPGMPLAISDDKRFLYASLRYEPYKVASFAIDPATGLLTFLGEGALAHSMAFVAPDRTNRWLLGASYPGSLIGISPIGADGIARGDAVQILPNLTRAHSIRADAANRFVYAPLLGDDAVLWAPFDAATGHLRESGIVHAKVTPGHGPRHFAFHPTAPFFYIDGELAGFVYAYRRDAETGALEELQSQSLMPEDFTGKPSASDLRMTPDGHFLYVAERVLSVVAAFAVDSGTGYLTFIDRFPVEDKPRAFNIDPNGRFLIVVGQESNHAGVHEIDQQTGALTLRHRYPTGRNPGWVECLALD